MKILQEGRKQKGWSTETKCTGEGNGKGGCGAELLVERADVFLTQIHSRDETDSFATFSCVNCGVLTDLKNFPPDLLRTLRPRAEQEKILELETFTVGCFVHHPSNIGQWRITAVADGEAKIECTVIDNTYDKTTKVGDQCVVKLVQLSHCNH